MPALASEYQCPSCNTPSQIFASAGELSCSKGHRWNDTQAFLDLNPQMKFKVKVNGNLPQENRTPLRVSIPIGLEDALRAKFTVGDVYEKERLESTVTAVLWGLTEGDSMILSAAQVAQLQEHLGKRPENSGELIGLVYSKVCEANDAKSERDTAVKDVQAYEGMSPGRVVIDLSDVINQVREKASDAQLPPKLWAERTLVNGIKDNWF